MSSLVFCTLLGPEGPGRASVWRLGYRPLDPLVTASSDVCRHGLGLRSLANYRPIAALNRRVDDTASTGKTKYRPYFENYTVDASILETACHGRSDSGQVVGDELISSIKI